MHFRPLCPSVMLASLHSGVVTSPFCGASAAEEACREPRKRRRWSWFDPREQDEDDKGATGETSEEGDDQKENRPQRVAGRRQGSGKGTRPIEVKRPALEAPSGLRRSPCMSLSPFALGLRFASSPPPVKQKAPPATNRPASPPPPPLAPSPPTPPPSPLATSPPEAVATHAMVTVVRRTATQSQRIPAGRAVHHREPQNHHPGAVSRRRGSLTALKSPLTMNPNQRFALVCLNDRFYWVSKEVESTP